jgi:DNA-binding NtrC family response regulator
MEPTTRVARELAGRSPAMARLRARILRVAGATVPVLLTGETGTGKSTAARVLHGISQRAQGPLVKVNCAGIPETLFEAELFGHEKGAFTGALQRRLGLLPRAHGGTLFLDELGELTASTQAKLLTALDEGEVRPVGGEAVVSFDARLLSATSRDLEDEIRQGRFRPDLFHRVAVVRVHLPPLRDRAEDLEILAGNALRELARRHRVPRPRISAGGLDYLAQRRWPGNVREFLHLLEAALVLNPGSEVLGPAELAEAVPEREGEDAPPPARTG